MTDEDLHILEALHGPRYFHRDGKPILSDELMPDFMQWALLFEEKDRIIGNTVTLYGEKLSTVWLGMNHNFFGGKPLIFETMLFAPSDNEEKMRGVKAFFNFDAETAAQKEQREKNEAYRKKYYPHDQLQLRYATEREASDRHEKLRLQCLIPPRWRHFLLWTIGRDAAWQFYDDEDDDTWN
jgi:hypothetical protein